ALVNAAPALKHGSEYSQTMGPVAVLYPPDREWAETTERTAPCGTHATVGNRSDFPLDDGFVALVADAVGWEVSLKISYSSDPSSIDDFEEWYHGNTTDEISIGHTCFYMPDQPSNIRSGDVATIQLQYMADDEQDGNVTHYACSDITFVEESVFEVTQYALSCFNATDSGYYSGNLAASASSTLVTTTITASSSDSAAA
ncbi:copper acquisition factor BIM1-like domain-containing protein ASCRUDRAFT_24938, partial [Ascoidea rubescens DSM 1968]